MRGREIESERERKRIVGDVWYVTVVLEKKGKVLQD